MEKDSQITMATLFFDIENVHLIKDPGMIPLTFQQHFGWKAIIPLWDDREYEYKDKYFKNIETPLLKNAKSDIIRRFEMTKWLLKNAPRIDVLHLYFYERWTWTYIWLFKLRNPKGIVYVHCDTDGERLIKYKLPKSFIKRFIIEKIQLKDKNIRDVLWGIQNKQNCEKLKNKWPFKNIVYISNGVNWNSDLEVDFQDRKNVLLTVARNGTPQKKTDLLLEGFAAIAQDFPKWNLRLVGTVEKNFEPYIEEYFKRNPELKDRICFSGPVTDREELQKIYSESKVFCLTSAWESFGLVTVEALRCGCYVIESDIPANVDVTQNGTYGTLFKSNSLENFVEKLKDCLSDEEHMQKVSSEAKRYVAENLTWERTLYPVVDWVSSKKESQL